MGVHAKMMNWMVSEDVIRIYPFPKKEIKFRFMRLLTLLSDIFLEEREEESLIFSPEDLTEHYRKEL
jgi:hypothetical protein